MNLGAGPGNRFDLLASRVRILDLYAPQNFPDVPHFWVKPLEGDVRHFLGRYGERGGTHHLALVLGDEVEAVGRMAQMLGIDFHLI